MNLSEVLSSSTAPILDSGCYGGEKTKEKHKYAWYSDCSSLVCFEIVVLFTLKLRVEFA